MVWCFGDCSCDWFGGLVGVDLVGVDFGVLIAGLVLGVCFGAGSVGFGGLVLLPIWVWLWLWLVHVNYAGVWCMVWFLVGWRNIRFGRLVMFWVLGVWF